MGQAVGQGWSDAGAQLFEESLTRFDEDFSAVKMHYLPQREVEQLVSYHDNVWETQLTPRAQAWYQRKQVISMHHLPQIFLCQVTDGIHGCLHAATDCVVHNTRQRALSCWYM